MQVWEVGAAYIYHNRQTGSIRVAAACVDRNPSTLTRGLKNVEKNWAVSCLGGYGAAE
ncbi:MAG: hypothetical protein V8R61_08840 [Enterocloster sp.]